MITESDVRTRLYELLRKANDPAGCPVKLYSTSLTANVVFDLKGRAAGMCRTRKTATGIDCVIRINREAMKIDEGTFVMQEVMPHEVAHLLSASVFGATGFPQFKGHGHGWRTLAIWLGASGSRTCSVGLKPSRSSKTYPYRASCGTAIELGAIRHRKVQAGAFLKLRTTGGKVRAEHYVGSAA